MKILKRGWVNITGMVGQHKTERWVNMLRNLQDIQSKIDELQKAWDREDAATIRSNAHSLKSLTAIAGLPQIERWSKIIDQLFADGIFHSKPKESINVEEYLSRGFEHLQINFGCTGGQHRSVFAAEQTARHLKNKYKLQVELTHLNQANWVK